MWPPNCDDPADQYLPIPCLFFCAITWICHLSFYIIASLFFSPPFPFLSLACMRLHRTYVLYYRKLTTATNIYIRNSNSVQLLDWDHLHFSCRGGTVRICRILFVLPWLSCLVVLGYTLDTCVRMYVCTYMVWGSGGRVAARLLRGLFFPLREVMVGVGKGVCGLVLRTIALWMFVEPGMVFFLWVHSHVSRCLVAML